MCNQVGACHQRLRVAHPMKTTQWKNSLLSLAWTKTREPHFLCICFLVLLAIPAVIYTANSLNLNQLQDKAKLNASTIAHGVGERIGVINTVLASLVGLHDVGTDLDNDKLLRFSNEILKNSAYIRNLGSYTKLPHDKRRTFEAQMSHNGYSDFSIGQLEESGRFTVRAEDKTYYPVSIAGPRHLTLPGLIGADLGALPEFTNALETIDGDRAPSIMELPDLWPLAGDLIAFQPVYTDNHEADAITHKGGFWLTLDIDRLFSGNSNAMDTFDASIELVDAEKRTLLRSIQKNDEQILFFSWLYSRRSIQEAWHITPTSKIVVTLHQPIGLTAGALAFMCTVLFLIIFCLLYTSPSPRDRQKSRMPSSA